MEYAIALYRQGELSRNGLLVYTLIYNSIEKLDRRGLYGCGVNKDNIKLVTLELEELGLIEIESVAGGRFIYSVLSKNQIVRSEAIQKIDTPTQKENPNTSESGEVSYCYDYF